MDGQVSQECVIYKCFATTASLSGPMAQLLRRETGCFEPLRSDLPGFNSQSKQNYECPGLLQ